MGIPACFPGNGFESFADRTGRSRSFMKTILRFLITLICVCSTRLGGAAVPAGGPSGDPRADKDWKAYEKAGHASPGKPWAQMSPLEQEKWFETLALDRRKRVLAFLANYPSDPRRWNMVYAMDPEQPRFVTRWGKPDHQGTLTNNVVDVPAVTQWKTTVENLKKAMSLAGDVPQDVRDSLAGDEVIKTHLEPLLESS